MPRASTTSDPFNAVAEPRRRHILELIADEERSVGEIADALDQEQPSASKHLQVLLNVGLVTVRREDRRTLYRTNAETLRTIHDWWVVRRTRRNCASGTRRKNIERSTPPHKIRRSPSLKTSPCGPRWSRPLRRSAQMGRLNQAPDGTPLPMILEAHPGGRWFRDLGGDNGHLWGLVQSIKRPTLLEIWGPLFMSTAATSTLLYRLTETPEGTLISSAHAGGAFPEDHRSQLHRMGLRCTRASCKAAKPQLIREAMTIIDGLLTNRNGTTRRVLERIP